MSLSERHRWCISKILDAFGPELSAEVVQAFVRQEVNLLKLTLFFRGESSGRLFVFYQPDVPEGEVIFIFSRFKFSKLLTLNFKYLRHGPKIQFLSNCRCQMAMLV